MKKINFTIIIILLIPGLIFISGCINQDLAGKAYSNKIIDQKSVNSIPSYAKARQVFSSCEKICKEYKPYDACIKVCEMTKKDTFNGISKLKLSESTDLSISANNEDTNNDPKISTYDYSYAEALLYYLIYPNSDQSYYEWKMAKSTKGYLGTANNTKS